MSQHSSGNRHVGSRREAEIDSLLRESIRASGLEGKPLQLGAKAFQPLGPELLAGMMGAPAWSLRLKRIEDGRAALTAEVEAAWGALAARHRRKPEGFAGAWRTYLAKVDLAPLNALIAKHNDYYPIEARLPIVYPSGDYRIPPGVDWPQQPIVAAALLDAYPADRDMAEYFQRRAGLATNSTPDA